MGKKIVTPKRKRRYFIGTLNENGVYVESEINFPDDCNWIESDVEMIPGVLYLKLKVRT